MIVLELAPGEAEDVAEVLLHAASCGAPSLLAYDPIDRAFKVKAGTWSKPLGSVVADD